MKLYSESEKYKLYHGSMLDMLQVIEPNTIDSIVTDPPYELNFMGKGWDNSGIAFQADTWKNCYEVLKPGGYLLAFGGSRTFHRIACAIEDAGFEIRDTIMWLYGSGFPKSMNIGLALDKRNGAEIVLGDVKPGHKDFADRSTNGDTKFNDGMSGFDRPWMHDEDKRKSYHYEKVLQTDIAKRWDGWGTALKPAFEPIIVARKPFKGSLVDNIVEYGVGGLNIDECRVALSDNEPDGRVGTNAVMKTDKDKMWFSENGYSNKDIKVYKDEGRFPANVILTYDETDYDEVCGGFPVSNVPNGSITNPNLKNSLGNNGIYGKYSDKQPLWNAYQDSGSAARYFYCSKASKKDRNEGCDRLETQYTAMSNQAKAELRRGNTEFHGDVSKATTAMNRVYASKNIHPTVKPTDLMQYLIRLVTPDGGTVLDPFNGSGSTGKAVMYENVERDKNYSYIGIELTEEYLPISQARIEYASSQEKEICVSKPEKVTEKCESIIEEQVNLW